MYIDASRAKRNSVAIFSRFAHFSAKFPTLLWEHTQTGRQRCDCYDDDDHHHHLFAHVSTTISNMKIASKNERDGKAY